MTDLIGTVVTARAGRDKGRSFAVIGISQDGEHLLLADGDTRKLERPKRKKPMHVAVENRRVQLPSGRDAGENNAILCKRLRGTGNNQQEL